MIVPGLRQVLYSSLSQINWISEFPRSKTIHQELEALHVPIVVKAAGKSPTYCTSPLVENEPFGSCLILIGK